MSKKVEWTRMLEGKQCLAFRSTQSGSIFMCSVFPHSRISSPTTRTQWPHDLMQCWLSMMNTHTQHSHTIYNTPITSDNISTISLHTRTHTHTEPSYTIYNIPITHKQHIYYISSHTHIHTQQSYTIYNTPITRRQHIYYIASHTHMDTHRATGLGLSPPPQQWVALYTPPQCCWLPRTFVRLQVRALCEVPLWSW